MLPTRKFGEMINLHLISVDSNNNKIQTFPNSCILKTIKLLMKDARNFCGMN